jgi:MFS family permease
VSAGALLAPGRPLADRRLLFAGAFLRAVATGLLGIVLGVQLARLSFRPAVAGALVGAGLAGTTAAMIVTTLAADRLGRRATLVALGLAGATGLAVVAAASTAALIGAACFLGMVNASGRDRGAAMVIEQSVLPATATDARRTAVFAWYNVLQDAGHALGSLLAGSTLWLRGHVPEGLGPLRVLLLVGAALHLVVALLHAALSRSVESASPAPLALSQASRGPVARIAALFALDSLGGGFLTTAGITLVFVRRFGVDEVALAPLFFAARVLNAGSHLAAAWLAKRIGLVHTMVFTHAPSSLLLLTVAIAPGFGVASVLFLLREGLVEMDVPTRQSYVMALVRPEERTAASGITSLVRTGMWAAGAPLAGLLMQGVSPMMPLVTGAALKLAYDGLLYRAFRAVRPPEERT